jgi:alpha/beta superfamily hydrolase
MTTVCFSHGQESGPWGTKIRAMAEAVRELGCEAHSVDYQGIAEPGDRVARLVEECGDLSAPLVLVGSSMGGYVATAAAPTLQAAGLFVLAPAYGVPGWPALPARDASIPHWIVHGWSDDVVPVDNSIQYAREHNATLHIVDGDHRLTANIDEIIGLLEQFIKNVVGDS